MYNYCRHYFTCVFSATGRSGSQRSNEYRIKLKSPVSLSLELCRCGAPFLISTALVKMKTLEKNTSEICFSAVKKHI